MPRFFFHVHDGKDMPDKVGTELPSWDVARRHAITAAGRIVADQAQQIAFGEDWRMEVTNEHGLVLFQIYFHVTESPAVRHGKVKKA